MPSSSAYPDLERKKGGPDNWVEAAGGLPRYIERIAKHLHYEKGHSISSAIAMAVNTVKRWATGTNHNGGKLKPQTVAKAAAAVAEWEKKKASAGAKRLKEAEFTATPDELAELGRLEVAHLNILEGIRSAWPNPSRLMLANAERFLGIGRSTTFRLEEATAPADPNDAARVGGLVAGEVAELEPFVEALTEARGEKKKAPPPPLMPKRKGGDPEKTRTQHLQRRLSSLGYEAKDDGKFGQKTHGTVREFQAGMGLKEDGIVGPKTTKALTSAPSPDEIDADEETPAAAVSPAANPAAPAKAAAAKAGGKPADPAPKINAMPTLHKGIGVDSEPNQEVERYQLELEELGYPNIAVDGRFGPKTESSTKRFQKKMGMKSDGIAGPKTRAVMHRLYTDLGEAMTRREAAGPADFDAALAAERVIRRRIEEGTLTAKGRKQIDKGSFALPGRRYPIHDLAHARNALARVAQHGSAEEQAKVRAAVYAKYPALKKRKLSEADSKGDKPGVAGGGSMKRCPSCGWKMKPGTEKCSKCGANLRKKGDAKTGDPSS